MVKSRDLFPAVALPPHRSSQPCPQCRLKHSPQSTADHTDHYSHSRGLGGGAGGREHRGRRIWALPSISSGPNPQGAPPTQTLLQDCGCAGCAQGAFNQGRGLTSSNRKQKAGWVLCSAETSGTEEEQRAGNTVGGCDPSPPAGPPVQLPWHTSCQPPGLSELKVPQHMHLTYQWPSQH